MEHLFFDAAVSHTATIYTKIFYLTFVLAFVFCFNTIQFITINNSYKGKQVIHFILLKDFYTSIAFMSYHQHN